MIGQNKKLKQKEHELMKNYFLIASIWPDVTQSNNSADEGFNSAFLAIRFFSFGVGYSVEDSLEPPTDPPVIHLHIVII